VAFSQKIASVICKALSEGKSLRAVCEADGMPSESTVRAWALDDVEGFAAQYARAREIGYERLADEILAIADTPQTGVKTTTKASGTETVEGDMIEHRRLQVDARKWMLAKMLPKKYGDRLQTEHTGPNGGPIESKTTLDVSGLSVEQLRAVASIRLNGE
jgi:hypothetical protein